MREAIYAALKPVRARQQTLFALRCVAVGLVAGAVGGLAVGVARLAFGLDVSPGRRRRACWPPGRCSGCSSGWPCAASWHDAAAAVDGHYGLKDRTVTALAFADQPTPTDLHALQMADAMAHLGTVEPKAVVPIEGPARRGRSALAALAAAAVVLAWPLAAREAEAGPAPAPEHIVAVAAEQQGEARRASRRSSPRPPQDLDDEKADEEKKGLKELLEKLLQKLEELTQPGTDEKEALAKLSEMQADDAGAGQRTERRRPGRPAVVARHRPGRVARRSRGPARRCRTASSKRPPRNWRRSTRSKLTPKEAKALEEKLKQLAKQMGDAGQGSLSDAVGRAGRQPQGRQRQGRQGDARPSPRRSTTPSSGRRSTTCCCARSRT